MVDPFSTFRTLDCKAVCKMQVAVGTILNLLVRQAQHLAAGVFWTISEHPAHDQAPPHRPGKDAPNVQSRVV